MICVEKLYNSSSYIFDFDATVVSCENIGDKYAIVLDRTAFFPEGGGQRGDVGTVGGAKIFDTQEDGGVVIHYSRSSVECGARLNCSVDRGIRFARMQNHSGEHIISGIIHKKYGYDNTGFHLGDDYITIDVNGELDAEQIAEIEVLANRVVWENVKTTVSYPSADELEHIEYRSKLDLRDNVRLVEIDGYDICACCAPHVSRTGEIGMIKIVDHMRYKGGMRLFVLCGNFALQDYVKRVKIMKNIAKELSLPDTELEAGFQNLQKEIAELKEKIFMLKSRICSGVVDSLHDTDGNICVFEELDANDMRKIVNIGMQRSKRVCAVFSGNDDIGYNYIIGSMTQDLKTKLNEINCALDGRGGGSSRMIQGHVSANKDKIEDFLKAF